MSFEQLIWIGIFILVPLLERLFRRGQQPRPESQAPDEPRPRPAPRPLPAPVPIETRPAPQVPRKPPPPRPAAIERPPPALPPSPPPGVDARLAPASPPRAGRRRRGTHRSVELTNPRELRRAIVLSTILGPCRAADPY